MRAAALPILFTTFYCGHANSHFEGELILEPTGCEVSRECYTKEAIRFTDPNELVWEAKQGLKTDGLTIPDWVRLIIRDPYDKSYLKAAVIHDHYCDRPVRSWRSTHRVFYHMLRDLGVPEPESKIMYYAVYRYGPKWVEIIPPRNCGANCINEFSKLTEAEKIRFQPGSYNDASNLEGRIENMKDLLNDKNLTLEQIEDLAESEEPGNVFFNNGDTIEFKLLDTF